MKKSDKIIRDSDLVRVVNPRRFIRCGYALDQRTLYADLYRNYEKPITEFLKSIDIPNTGPRQYDKILRALAFAKVAAHGFGGPQREVHTEPLKESIVGETFRVYHTFFVRTGTYDAPSRGQDYFGEHWYDPGGLTDPKTHKIIRFDQLGDRYLIKEPKDDFLDHYNAQRPGLMMLAADVEKIIDDSDTEYPPQIHARY